jgi:hypothetical protein
MNAAGYRIRASVDPVYITEMQAEELGTWH